MVGFPPPPKEPLFWLTSDETDMLAFVWLRGKRGSRTERCSVWGGGGGREEGKEGALWQVSPHLLSDGYVAVARLRRLGPSDAR